MLERRHVDSIVRRVDQMEGSQITRGKGKPRKTIRLCWRVWREREGFEKKKERN